MGNTPEDNFREFNTVKVPAVMIATDGDPKQALDAGIVDPVRIPVRIVVKRKRSRPPVSDDPNS